MTQRYRALSSALGPDTRGAWAPFAHTGVIPLTLMTDAQDYVLYVVPPVSTISTQAAAPVDLASSSGYTATLTGIYVTTDLDVAANIASNVYFSVYRAEAQLGSARIGGWTSGAVDAWDGLVPNLVPWYVTNTTALTGPPNATLSSSRALCRLKPLDVITVAFGDVDASGLSGVNFTVSLDIQ